MLAANELRCSEAQQGEDGEGKSKDGWMFEGAGFAPSREVFPRKKDRVC